MLTWLAFIFGLLLPVSWAKHWLISSSLVNGVLVDYLMPDLWLQDIIAAAIIVFSVIQLRVTGYGFFKILTRNSRTRNAITLKLFSIMLIIISIISSSIPLISAINFTRFLLAMSVSWIIFKNKDLHRSVLLGLAGGVIWTTILAGGQFVYQGTVFGWRFFGEPTFSLGTGGIKKLTLFGFNFLAPMATFPHANVMGAFGLLTFLLFKNKDLTVLKISKYFSLVLAILSFSIPIYLVLLYILVSLLLKNKRNSFLGWGILSFLLVYIFYNWGLIDLNSIYRRWELIKASFSIFRQNLLFGIGWGTFVKNLPKYSEINFLQPVHNVFLLILSELGILGTTGLVLIARKYLRKFKFKNHLLLITVYLLLFTFDHYFWSVTQGVYLLFLFISMEKK